MGSLGLNVVNQAFRMKMAYWFEKQMEKEKENTRGRSVLELGKGRGQTHAKKMSFFVKGKLAENKLSFLMDRVNY